MNLASSCWCCSRTNGQQFCFWGKQIKPQQGFSWTSVCCLQSSTGPWTGSWARSTCLTNLWCWQIHQGPRSLQPAALFYKVNTGSRPPKSSHTHQFISLQNLVELAGPELPPWALISCTFCNICCSLQGPCLIRHHQELLFGACLFTVGPWWPHSSVWEERAVFWQPAFVVEANNQWPLNSPGLLEVHLLWAAMRDASFKTGILLSMSYPNTFLWRTFLYDILWILQQILCCFKIHVPRQ